MGAKNIGVTREKLLQGRYRFRVPPYQGIGNAGGE
jgi:hypothetical protein